MDDDSLFPQLNDICYLDHAGVTIPSSRQLERHCKFLQSNILLNPHSTGPEKDSDYVENARHRVLEFFGTTFEEYTVIFTSGATASIQKVGECFSYGRSGLLCYLNDNHTSVLGLREYALTRGAEVCCVFEEQLHLVKSTQQTDLKASQPSTYTKPPATCGLFVYPAQSNFSGRKYNIMWASQLKSGTLSLGSACNDWYVMVDAASLVATSPLQLSGSDIDFVPVSFYKIFGYPTGLGALLVKNSSFHKLKKVYFGGGSVEGAGVEKFFHYPRHNKSQWFEDGTIPFQQITALQFGFDELFTRGGGMKAISSHTYLLTKLVHDTLQSLTHYNGCRVVELYCDSEFWDPRLQGPILAFNLLRSNGEYIGYNEVQCMASVYKITFRTGCCCNIGACQKFLHISTQQLHDNHKLGHRCGDSVDMIEGKPTGAVRVSFGYMSTVDDVQRLVDFIKETFCETLDRAETGEEGSETAELATKEMELSAIHVYPVKSCAPFKVSEWPISKSGLLYDRNWSVVDSRGACLTLKRNADLRKIRPSIDVKEGTLTLSAEGFGEVSLSTEEGSKLVHTRVCSVKICGKMLDTVDCGEKAALWISDVLAVDGCRLVRRLAQGEDGDTDTSMSLSNDSQYLLISKSSVTALCTYITNNMNCSVDDGEISDRFRANLVISGGKADEECSWSHIQIGNTHFKCIGECGRCSLISIDQETGERVKEPLRSLTRRKGDKPTFGIHLANMDFRDGLLKVGNRLLVKEDLPQ